MHKTVRLSMLLLATAAFGCEKKHDASKSTFPSQEEVKIARRAANNAGRVPAIKKNAPKINAAKECRAGTDDVFASILSGYQKLNSSELQNQD